MFTNRHIGITYSIIAPLMLFWSTLGMAFFYLAYRYNILFITDTNIDTRLDPSS